MALQFTLEERFDAPPETVFRALTDLDKAGEWMPGFVSLEKLSEGEFGAGTEWRETRKMYGRKATEQFQVTRYQPHSNLELFVDGTKGTTGRGHFRFAYDLAPADQGTIVKFSGEIGGMGRIMELLGRLFLPSFKKACARDLQAVRAHVHAGLRSPAA
jgi:carbon monoxide dehydrogenase subunit G